MKPVAHEQDTRRSRLPVTGEVHTTRQGDVFVVGRCSRADLLVGLVRRGDLDPVDDEELAAYLARPIEITTVSVVSMPDPAIHAVCSCGGVDVLEWARIDRASASHPCAFVATVMWRGSPL